LDQPLIALRVAHLVATALTAGTLAFLLLVAAPAMHAASMPVGADRFMQQCRRIARIGLVAALMSGVAWLVLEVPAMSGLPLVEAVREGMVAVVLTQTQFGIVADVRLGFMAVLAVALALPGANDVARWVSLACAAGLLASLAWTGHAAGTVGRMATPHLIADALHLLAAGTWIGGLLPLALLLARTRASQEDEWALLAHAAARRFSMLGITSVATLIATGLVNAWILVGSWQALIATEYGRLLLAKLALFTVILALAALNRLYLTPRLAPPPGPLRAQAVRLLIRSSTTEIGVGLAIFGIVGVLGAIHPAIHLLPP
jgi:copper resistance protein D